MIIKFSRPTKGGLTTNRTGVGILLLVVGSVIVGGVKKAVRSKEKNTFEP